MAARDPEKHRANVARYYLRHQSELQAKQRAYHAAHREEQAERKRAKYWANRDAVLEATKDQREAYRKSEHGRAVIQAGVKRWAERNPDKRKAQHAVNNAVAAGRLTKQPCEICGAGRVHAHHPFGYVQDMQLAVWWLCPPHHFGMHMAVRGA